MSQLCSIILNKYFIRDYILKNIYIPVFISVDYQLFDLNQNIEIKHPCGYHNLISENPLNRDTVFLLLIKATFAELRFCTLDYVSETV